FRNAAGILPRIPSPHRTSRASGACGFHSSLALGALCPGLLALLTSFLACLDALLRLLGPLLQMFADACLLGRVERLPYGHPLLVDLVTLLLEGRTLFGPLFQRLFRVQRRTEAIKLTFAAFLHAGTLAFAEVLEGKLDRFSSALDPEQALKQDRKSTRLNSVT